MEYIKLLNKYHDGSISPGEERALFNCSARNEMVRSQLLQVISLKQSGVKLKGLVPGQSSTKELFGRLGYSFNAPTGPLSMLWSNISMKLGNHISTILSSVIAAALTASIILIYLNYFDDNADTIAESRATTVAIKGNTEHAGPLGHDVRTVSAGLEEVRQEETTEPLAQNTQKAMAYTNESTMSEQIESNIHSNIIGNEQGAELVNQADEAEDFAEQGQATCINLISHSPCTFADHSLNTTRGHSLLTKMNSYVPIAEYFEAGQNNFELKILSNSPIHLNDYGVSPSNSSSLLNYSVAGFYQFDDEFAVGLSLRQETFHVKYRAHEQDGKLYEYRQQPIFTSADLFLRYKYSLSESLQCMAQIGGGGNYYGATGRLGCGLVYNIMPNIALNLISEYDMLFFGHEQSLYTAEKIGIYYGVSYAF